MDRVEALEPWSATAFLVAGGLWLGFAVYNGLSLLNVVASPSSLVNDALFLSGFLAGFAGLFALYPRAAADAPELAKAGAVFAAIGAVAHTVDRLAALLVSLISGTPFGDVVTGLEPLYLVTFLSTIVAFFMLSRASAQAEGPSPTTSRLLLVPPIVLTVYMFSATVVRHPGYVFVVWGTVAVSWLALGYHLRSAEESAEQPDASTDSPA